MVLHVIKWRFTPSKVRVRWKAWKQGILRVPQVLVNNVDFRRQECAPAEADEMTCGRIVCQQTTEFLPSRVGLDVGEVELCQLHSAHCITLIIEHWILNISYYVISTGVERSHVFIVISTALDLRSLATERTQEVERSHSLALQSYKKSPILPRDFRKLIGISAHNVP